MESTLSLQYKQLTGEVGEFLGYGRGPDNNNDSAWTAAQKSDIDFCVASGMRCFYYPEPLEGETASYQWSFLRPTASFDFPANAQTITLPDDFGGFEGNLTLNTSASTAAPWKIEWRNEGSLREMYSITPTMTGPPMFAAQVPLKGTTATQGQRFQVMMFPLADQDYTVQGTYYIAPDYLSGAFPFAYGGSAHAETLLESCLAIAEQRRDDAMSVHSAKFLARLRASVSMDRRLKPQKLGTNLDRSDRRGWNRRDAYWSQPAATLNGQGFG